MASIPPPIRASLGLVASAVDAVQSLLDRAPELLERTPELGMDVVGNAMQASMRAQQRYAEFIARGDELISQLRGVPDEPPAWATFDDLPDPADPHTDTDTATDLPPVPDTGLRTPAHGDPLLPHAAAAEPAPTSPFKKASAPRKAATPGKATAPRKATPKKTAAAGRATPAKKAPGKKAPGKKAPGEKAPAKKVARTTGPATDRPGVPSLDLPSATGLDQAALDAPTLDAALTGASGDGPRSAFDRIDDPADGPAEPDPSDAAGTTGF